jgi:hypothetical protein
MADFESDIAYADYFAGYEPDSSVFDDFEPTAKQLDKAQEMYWEFVAECAEAFGFDTDGWDKSMLWDFKEIMDI